VLKDVYNEIRKRLKEELGEKENKNKPFI